MINFGRHFFIIRLDIYYNKYYTKVGYQKNQITYQELKLEKVFLIIGAFFTLIIGIGIRGLIMGFPTMWLWNWLMPTIFGLTKIGFWQSVGLMFLSGLLIRLIELEGKHEH